MDKKFIKQQLDVVRGTAQSHCCHVPELLNQLNIRFGPHDPHWQKQEQLRIKPAPCPGSQMCTASKDLTDCNSLSTSGKRLNVCGWVWVLDPGGWAAYFTSLSHTDFISEWLPVSALCNISIEALTLGFLLVLFAPICRRCVNTNGAVRISEDLSAAFTAFACSVKQLFTSSFQPQTAKSWVALGRCSVCPEKVHQISL